MELLSLKNVEFGYNSNKIINNLNLSVSKGEFVTLLGSSGCGKTTTLKLISGFLNPEKGQIFMNGKLLNGILPNKRKIGMVFQDYALFPHMTVQQNMHYGLKLKDSGIKNKDEKKQKVFETAEALGLPAGGTVRLRCLSDSGALLCEPVSGSPVIIADLPAVRPCLSPELFEALSDGGLGTTAEGMRLIPGGGIGGSMLLPGFLPRRVRVCGVERTAVIAVVNGTDLGGFDGIVPASLCK